MKITGIGNAIVDILIDVGDEVLIAEGLQKGSMSLIDEVISQQLCQKYNPQIQCSGGSAANTIAGIAGLGSPSAFIGKVKTTMQMIAILFLGTSTWDPLYQDLLMDQSHASHEW